MGDKPRIMIGAGASFLVAFALIYVMPLSSTPRVAWAMTTLFPMAVSGLVTAAFFRAERLTTIVGVSLGVACLLSALGIAVRIQGDYPVFWVRSTVSALLMALIHAGVVLAIQRVLARRA